MDERDGAPWWHTAIVLVFLAAGSIASAYQHGLSNLDIPGLTPRLSSYVTVLAKEWFAVFLIWAGFKYQGLAIGGLIAGRWPTYGAFLKDLGLAVAFLLICVPLIGVLASHLGAGREMANMVPKTWPELVTWLVLSVTAGFCEELIYRGYLIHQFRIWTKSRTVAVVLQAIIFGLAHGYYYQAMVVVMLQGLLLGLLAYWRKSLRPGMLAHGLQDAVGGVAGFLS